MSEPSNGCLDIVQNVLMLFAALFSFGGQSVVSPPTSPQQTALVMVVAPTEAATDDELALTANVLDSRLAALGVLAEPAEVAGGEITLYLSDDPGNAFTDVGYLEFVDFSGIENTEAYTGRAISTDGQIAQFGAALNPDAIDNPVTLGAFETVLTNDGIANASAAFEDISQTWLIEFSFMEADGAVMGDFTERNVGQPLAIVVDGIVITVPIIQARLDTGGVITGTFTETEARALAAQIQSQPLPFPLEIISIGTPGSMD